MHLQLIIYLCLELIIVISAKHVKIIGGDDADIKEFPYMASLRLYKEQQLICGGVIISNNYILTAAHCFDKRHISNIRVYVGTNDSTNYTVPYYIIRKVKIHPKFLKIDKRTQWTVLNDIALVKVEPCIEFNEFQNKIDLPTQDIQSDDKGIMTGWGYRTFPRGRISDKLQKIYAKSIVNATDDEQYPSMVNDNHICAIQEENLGICLGDSGGPLISNGKVVGICSFGRSCLSNSPDVYTKVYSYLDFIESNIIDSSENSCCCF